MGVIENRYDFSLLFDCEMGNPNGDPDAGNLPRVDAETGIGVVTDVCLKRKIRNYVDLVRDDESTPLTDDGHGFKIYVREGAVLNDQNARAWTFAGLKPSKTVPKGVALGDLTKVMCDNFYDVRTFGAVMSTGVNCGQVRGPVQMRFATSVDPVVPTDMCITRVARTKDDDKGANAQMGRKAYIPYGLYRVDGFVSANLAERTGFDEEDLNLLFEALGNMFEDDRSASRGLMTSRKLVVFKHESRYGNAHAHDLFDTVRVERTGTGPARSYRDYRATVDYDAVKALSDHVQVIEM